MRQSDVCVCVCAQRNSFLFPQVLFRCQLSEPDSSWDLFHGWERGERRGKEGRLGVGAGVGAIISQDN